MIHTILHRTHRLGFSGLVLVDLSVNCRRRRYQRKDCKREQQFGYRYTFPSGMMTLGPVRRLQR
jgi:hypothetical protein